MFLKAIALEINIPVLEGSTRWNLARLHIIKAWDTLFNQRDYVAVKHYWSPNYIQHSSYIEPGREGLFNFIKSLAPTLEFEPGIIMADGDFVIVHGRFSGFGQPMAWIVVDILRIKEGVLAEHWDVVQDEVTQEQSKSRLPMFGDNNVGVKNL